MLEDMPETHASHDIPALEREAEAATKVHDCTVWIGYGGLFFLLPFAVLLFRLHMQAWHYYLAGALFLVSAVVVLALERAALARRDRAIEALQRARDI